VAQHQAVAVGINDGDPPSVPIGIARGNAPATGVDEPTNEVRIERSADVEHEKVFVGRARQRFPLRVVDELQMPRRLRPPKHHEGVAAFSFRPGSVQHLECEPISPEVLGSLQVAAGAGDAEMARRVQLHANSILDGSCAR